MVVDAVSGFEGITLPDSAPPAMNADAPVIPLTIRQTPSQARSRVKPVAMIASAVRNTAPMNQTRLPVWRITSRVSTAPVR